MNLNLLGKIYCNKKKYVYSYEFYNLCKGFIVYF